MARRETHGRWVRAARRGAVAVAITALSLSAGAAGVAGLAGTASASDAGSSITNPANGSSYSANTSIHLDASVRRQATGCGLFGCTTDSAVYTLTLTDPQGNPAGSWQDSGQCSNGSGCTSAIQACLSTDHGPVADPNCANANGTPAVNGTWTLTLTGNGQHWTNTFSLGIPAKAPTQVSAAPIDGTNASLTWAANPEPDVDHYNIYDGANLLGAVSAADFCSGGQCGHAIHYSDANAPGQHILGVNAVRLDGRGGQEAAGPTTQANPITLTGPAPTPTPGPSGNPSPGPSGGSGGGGGGSGGGGSGGGGTGGGGTGSGSGSGGHGSGGSGTGGSGSGGTPAQQRQVAVTFKDFAPPSGIIKLPPLPVATLPGEAPIPDGTFAPTLAYGDQYLPEGVLTKKAGTTSTGFVDTLSQSFQGTRLWHSIAWALLLLLASGHLFVWLRRAGRADGFDW